MIVPCARSLYSSGVKATYHSERPSCHLLHLASKVLKLAPNSASTGPLSATLACRFALSEPCILRASMIRYGRQSRRSRDVSHGISQKPCILINGRVSRFEPRVRDHNNGYLGSLYVINKAEKATRDLYKKKKKKKAIKKTRLHDFQVLHRISMSWCTSSSSRVFLYLYATPTGATADEEAAAGGSLDLLLPRSPRPPLSWADPFAPPPLVPLLEGKLLMLSRASGLL